MNKKNRKAKKPEPQQPTPAQPPQPDPAAEQAAQAAMARAMQIMSSFTEQEQEVLKKQFGSELSRAKVERKLKAQIGLETDELKTLYPDDKDLFKFYLEEATQLKNISCADEEEDPEDTYQLTPANERDLEELELLEKRRKRQQGQIISQELNKLKKGLDKPSDEARKKFEAAGAHLPKEQQVSYDDMLKGLKDALSTDDEKD
jgi:hypothetical protein